MRDLKLALVLLVIAYIVFHRHHYRRHRRNGFGVWYAMRGPFGTRVRVSKRL